MCEGTRTRLCSRHRWRGPNLGAISSQTATALRQAEAMLAPRVPCEVKQPALGWSAARSLLCRLVPPVPARSTPASGAADSQALGRMIPCPNVTGFSIHPSFRNRSRGQVLCSPEVYRSLSPRTARCIDAWAGGGREPHASTIGPPAAACIPHRLHARSACGRRRGSHRWACISRPVRQPSSAATCTPTRACS
jgi:hypothetical protein